MAVFAQSNTAARIRSAASRGTLSHALIFSGASDRVIAARYAAAGYVCTAEGERPCLQCAHCRKVMADIHPDVNYVRDSEHKELSAETVRAMRSDTFIRPNEAERKVYIFEDCSILNVRDQNILLKTIEEGPSYCAFLFCAENSAALLQTIRSRCVEWKLGGTDTVPDSDRADAIELCRLSAKGSAASRAAFTAKLENGKRKRDDLCALFEEARLLFADALLAQYGAEPEDAQVAQGLAKHLTRAKLMRMIELLDSYRRYCGYNVSAGSTLGGFAVEWERILTR
ncbi:MAG: DNA polymerase III subunit delta' [Oscillospiraceae bacterium]|nr:DNA polymerase III subunit delta' [Oscillospiraceae bacterium]